MTRPCDMLPPVKGSITRDAALKEMLWFRAGGHAEALLRPADAEDLAMFLAARPRDVAVQVIGVGSNLLVRDGGVPGVVMRLPAAFGKIKPTAPASAPALRHWMPPWLAPPPKLALPAWNSCAVCLARWAERCA